MSVDGTAMGNRSVRESPSTKKLPSRESPRTIFRAPTTRSSKMQSLFTRLASIAATDLPLTFVGETGSGKGFLARTVHEQSRRADRPLVVFDCGAFAPDGIEDELFGRDPEANGRTMDRRAGALERARGGSLLLERVTLLPLGLQSRIVGAFETCNVRVMCAATEDPLRRVEAGDFLQDLYFRLAAVVVAVPPLRDRLGDLPLLVEQLLAELGRPDIGLAPAALELLRERAWPGNVRELKNALACAIALDDTTVLEAAHLRAALAETNIERSAQLSLVGHTLEELERLAIVQTLEQTNGIKARAARALGIAVSTLYEKLKKYGLEQRSGSGH